MRDQTALSVDSVYDLERGRNKRGDKRGGDREMTEKVEKDRDGDLKGSRDLSRKRAEDERRLTAYDRELGMTMQRWEERQ